MLRRRGREGDPNVYKIRCCISRTDGSSSSTGGTEFWSDRSWSCSHRVLELEEGSEALCSLPELEKSLSLCPYQFRIDLETVAVLPVPDVAPPSQDNLLQLCWDAAAASCMFVEQINFFYWPFVGARVF